MRPPMTMFLPTRSLTGKNFLGLGAVALGLAGGLLILAGSISGSLGLLGVLLSLGVFYGTYLMYRGRSGILFRGTRTRTGAFINLAIGILTLLVPGGVGDTVAIVIVLSGILGLLAT